MVVINAALDGIARGLDALLRETGSRRYGFTLLVYPESQEHAVISISNISQASLREQVRGFSTRLDAEAESAAGGVA